MRNGISFAIGIVLFLHLIFTPLTSLAGELVNACRKGDMEAVKTLVQNGADVNETDDRGNTALGSARSEGIALYLISKGADIEGQGKKSGFTFLMSAAMHNWLYAAEKALEMGVDVNAVTSGRTALEYAAGRGHLDMVKFLVDHGAKVNDVQDKASRPLYMAAHQGHEGVVRYLVEKGASINTPFIMRKLNEKKIVFEVPLPEEIADPNKVTGIMTPFIASLVRQYESVALFLLSKGAKLDESFKKGFQTEEPDLFLSLYCGMFPVAARLVENGANVNATVGVGPLQIQVGRSSGAEFGMGMSRPQSTPDRVAFFHYFMGRSNEKAVWGFLAAHHANTEVYDRNGDTPLTRAAKFGRLYLVKTLVDAGADINAATRTNDKTNGLTPFQIAVANRRDKVAEYLLSKGAGAGGTTPNGSTVLIEAVKAIKEKLVRSIIASGKADLNAKDKGESTALTYAARWNNPDIMKLLLDNGANPSPGRDKQGRSPLKTAAESGNLPIVLLLLEHGADPNEGMPRYSILQRVCANGHLDVVRALVKHGAKQGEPGKSQVHVLAGAASMGKLEIVKVLVEAGWDVNFKNIHGQTALLSACMRKGNLEVIRYLLDRGADINAQLDLRGKPHDSPLLRSLVNGLFDYAKLLIERGADVNACNSMGTSPLMVAVRRGNIEMVKMLIEKGADVAAKEVGGSTSLIYAKNAGRQDMVDLLMSKGANMDDYTDSLKAVRHLIECGALPKFFPEDKAMPGMLEYMKQFGIEDPLSYEPDPNKSTPEKTWAEFKAALLRSDKKGVRACFMEAKGYPYDIIKDLNEEQMKHFAEALIEIKLKEEVTDPGGIVRDIWSFFGWTGAEYYMPTNYDSTKPRYRIDFIKAFGEWRIVNFL